MKHLKKRYSRASCYVLPLRFKFLLSMCSQKTSACTLRTMREICLGDGRTRFLNLEVASKHFLLIVICLSFQISEFYHISEGFTGCLIITHMMLPCNRRCINLYSHIYIYEFLKSQVSVLLSQYSYFHSLS